MRHGVRTLAHRMQQMVSLHCWILLQRALKGYRCALIHASERALAEVSRLSHRRLFSERVLLRVRWDNVGLVLFKTDALCRRSMCNAQSLGSRHCWRGCQSNSRRLFTLIVIITTTTIMIIVVVVVVAAVTTTTSRSSSSSTIAASNKPHIIVTLVGLTPPHRRDSIFAKGRCQAPLRVCRVQSDAPLS